MSKTLRILILEDLPSDAELTEREVLKCLPDCEFRRVETRDAFLANLETFQPDLILSDYRMPRFDGLSALRLALERLPDVPFIITTGSLNEDTAVECMKAGAWDYVIKEHQKRLGPAVLSALEKKHVRLEKLRAEANLWDSERKLKEAQHLGRIGHWEYDPETKDTLWSDEVFSIYARDPKLGLPSPEEQVAFYSPEDIVRLEALFARVLDSGASEEIDIALRLPDEGTKFLSVRAAVVHKAGPGRPKILGTVQDITERKQAEEGLREALRENQALFREIQHRVKNNLQLISSLINLQKNTLKEPRIIDVLVDINRRIRAIALVHEKLFSSPDLARIDFSEYLQGLAIHLFHSHGADGELIRFHPSLEKIELDIQTAVPCGLIVTELLSNAVQHAFPGKKGGKVRLILSRLKDGTISLAVEDDGCGLPEYIDFREPKTLGFQIVSTLITQLEATLDVRRDKGTAFWMTFKELEYKPRT